MALLDTGEVDGVPFYTMPFVTRSPPRYRWLEGHQWEVYGTAFSRDGRTIATAGYDKTVELFEVPPRDEPDSEDFVPGTALLKGHRFPVLHVAFGATDNTIVSTGRDGTVHLWQRNGAEAYVGTVRTPPRPLPPSPSVEQVESAYLAAQQMIVSVALSVQDTPEGHQRTLARYRRWSLSPDSLSARLRQWNKVRMPRSFRDTLIPVERDIAVKRTADCEERIRRAVK